MRFLTPAKILLGEMIRVGETTDKGAASGVATITACSIKLACVSGSLEWKCGIAIGGGGSDRYDVFFFMNVFSEDRCNE